MQVNGFVPILQVLCHCLFPVNCFSPFLPVLLQEYAHNIFGKPKIFN